MAPTPINLQGLVSWRAHGHHAVTASGLFWGPSGQTLLKLKAATCPGAPCKIEALLPAPGGVDVKASDQGLCLDGVPDPKIQSVAALWPMILTIAINKPHKFIGFGAMAITKPYKFIGFGAIAITKPYKIIGFGPHRSGPCRRVVRIFLGGLGGTPQRGVRGREPPKIRRGVWGAAAPKRAP